MRSPFRFSKLANTDLGSINGVSWSLLSSSKRSLAARDDSEEPYGEVDWTEVDFADFSTRDVFQDDVIAMVEGWFGA